MEFGVFNAMRTLLLWTMQHLRSRKLGASVSCKASEKMFTLTSAAMKLPASTTAKSSLKSTTIHAFSITFLKGTLEIPFRKLPLF